MLPDSVLAAVSSSSGTSKASAGAANELFRGTKKSSVLAHAFYLRYAAALDGSIGAASSPPSGLVVSGATAVAVDDPQPIISLIA